MSDIKLWLSYGACSLAPHILLHEIGMPFEAVVTPVSEGANLTDMRSNWKKSIRSTFLVS